MATVKDYLKPPRPQGLAWYKSLTNALAESSNLANDGFLSGLTPCKGQY